MKCVWYIFYSYGCTKQTRGSKKGANLKQHKLTTEARISNSNSNEAIPQQEMPYKDKKKEAERQRKIRRNKKKKDKRLNALLQFVEKENPRLLQRFDDQYVEEDDDLDQAQEAALDEVLQEPPVNPLEEVPSPVPDVGELMASLDWNNLYFLDHLEDPHLLQRFEDQYVEEDQAQEAALDEVLQEPPVFRTGEHEKLRR